MQSRIHVDFFHQSSNDLLKTTVSFIVSKENAKRTLKILEEHRERLHFDRVYTETGLAKVSIVGKGLSSTMNIVARTYTALDLSNVSTKMICTSQNNISCLVPVDRMVTVVRTFHCTFGLDTTGLAMVH
jgi:aspartate kinase